MIENIKWLGHDTFRIAGGIAGDKLIYTDPYKIKVHETADIIFISHSHYDHCSPEDILKLQGKHTVIIAPSDCQPMLSGDVRIVKPSDTLNVLDISIKAVPAYNTNKPFHLKIKEWVGYIFTINGKTIYFAGDTDYIPEMKSFKGIDIAMLPVSGTYVMTVDEAVKAAKDIGCPDAIPMHYGTIVGAKEDAERFKILLKGEVDVHFC